MKVIDAAFHRNGMGGISFYVGLVEHKGERLLVITFEGDPQHTAVIDPAQAAAGNIYMHPVAGIPNSGDNAYRGEHFDHLRTDFERIVRERHKKEHS